MPELNSARSAVETWLAGPGTKMALPKSVFDVVSPSNGALDVGNPVWDGGDSDTFRRVLTAVCQIIYDPEAFNWHRHRRDWQDLCCQLISNKCAGLAVWAESLFKEGNSEALSQAWSWLRRELPALARRLLRLPGRSPSGIIWARFR